MLLARISLHFYDNGGNNVFLAVLFRWAKGLWFIRRIAHSTEPVVKKNRLVFLPFIFSAFRFRFKLVRVLAFCVEVSLFY